MQKDRTDKAVKEHLERRKPGIERIRILCDECLEHDSSWYEFLYRCKETLVQEDKRIRGKPKQ